MQVLEYLISLNMVLDPTLINATLQEIFARKWNNEISW